jgi:hypothetical protein
MEQMNKKHIPMIVAFFLGIFCSFIWGKVLISKNATPENINYGLTTFYIIYAAIVTIPISFFSSASPWALSWMLILGHYFSGLVFIPYFGQLGPFDIVFIFIFTVPSIIVAFLIKEAKKRIRKYSTDKSS